MSIVTTGGLTVPEDTDPVAQGAAAMRTMAGKLGATATGLASVVVNNSTTGTLAVTFPAGRFTATPAIAMGTANTAWIPGPTGASASGFTANVRQYSGSPSSGTVNVYWVAVQAP